MARWIIGQGGLVVNVVESATKPVEPGSDVVLDRANNTNAGGTYDIRDGQIDDVDQVAFKILLRHENLLRELIRALRATSAGANTAANNAGLPTAANSADVTIDQFRAAIKALI